MNNFEKIYLKIINQEFCISNLQYKELTQQLKHLYPLNHLFLDTFQILNETIKIPELTPVPDQVLIQCYKNLQKITKSIFKISYQKIFKIVQNSTYILSNVFCQNLKKYAKNSSGNLYIFKSSIDINLNSIQTNKTYKLLLSQIQDQNRIYQFLAQLINNKLNNNTLFGLTIIKRQLDINQYKDCLIFIEETNKNFKDTMQHQFTHFIQRICMFDQKLPKIYPNKLNKNIQKIYSIFDKIFENFNNKENINLYKWNLYKFINAKIEPTQQHETIKSLIKFFIRYYQNQKKLFLINHKYYKISQIENFENKNIIKSIRINWLNQLLQKINTYKIFQNNILENYILNKKQTTQNLLILFSIIYLIIKNIYMQYNIDNYLKQQFITFKYRDF